MKVIDLLNKIANGEEVPKKIKYKGDIYKKEQFGLDYYTKEEGYGLFLKEINDTNCLNDKVEIIEEEKLIFEEINESSVPHKLFYNVDSGEDENSVEHKVNQLIRNQKKLIKEVNELKKGK